MEHGVLYLSKERELCARKCMFCDSLSIWKVVGKLLGYGTLVVRACGIEHHYQQGCVVISDVYGSAVARVQWGQQP